MKKKMHPKIQWHLILYITVFILALLPMTNSAYADWGDIVYENIYVWSNDWTSVTATRLKFQKEMGIGLDGGSIIADATINTVITKGEDGKLTYTASFEDPFSLQERTCIDLNDITNRWDFESDPASDGWSSDTEAVWHSNSTADCRSGQGCLAPAGNNMAYTPALRLPKNARLSFWASWPDSTWSSSSGNYPPGPGKEYNYVVVYCGTNKNEMKQIYRSEVSRQLYKHVAGGAGSQILFYTTDYLQQNIDLSEYAGERVYLKFGFVNNKDEPSTGYIDDLTIHGQPLDISQAEITVSPVTYTGEALKPLPVVTLNGKTLLNDMDYTIDYANNKEIGTATLTITGIGNCTGTKTAAFEIEKKNYKVTFDLNGRPGTAPAAQTITEGGKLTEPKAPTSGGYTFEGWYKETSCVNTWNFSADIVANDTILYAKWTENKAEDKDSGSQDAMTNKLKDNATGATFTIVSANSKNPAVSYQKANPNAKEVTIASAVTINNVTYKIVAISDGAFKNNKKLTRITIGKNVKKIGKNAFKGCKKLMKITIKTTKLTSKTVGANAFKGINKKAVFKCPKSKKTAYKKILLKKGAKKTMTFK